MKSPGRWLKRIGVTLFVLAVLLALPVLPPITIPSFPARPGEDSLELVVNKGYDLNAVAEVFLGSQYRDLWAQPVKVEVLDLGSVEGGLRPTREGGGQETRSLHFESAGGRHFTFRSVDKEVLRLLLAGLARSPVGWLVHDQTSSSFPAGALVANPLQESVGVPSGHPRLVVMADDARLGVYRAKFAGILGLLQEGPEEYVRLIPDGAAVNEVKATEEVLPLADGTSRHRMDAHSFLTARLVDGFLNDWDRHAGQWRWAPVQESWGTRWLAIPVDRDQSFSSYDGVLMALARLRTRKLAVFGPELPSVKGLTYNSRDLDRRFLAGLDRKTWDSTAAFVAGRLSDSVIDAAVKQLPGPWYRLEGAKLAATLKRRRERLAAFATTFYLYLAKHSEVFATMEAETAHLDYQPDGGVEVRVGSMAGGREQESWFVRRYLPAETGRIDLHLGGGKDRVVRSGTPSRTIAVHVFDEKGREVAMSQFLDSSGIRP
jgi:hypothetical protein